MNIILMAGGGGSRLWPLSRKDNPKQFIDLGAGRTLLESTYERARKLTEKNNIYLATSIKYKNRVSELLAQIPRNHIFCEPEKRDTTAAFVAVALKLQALGKGNEPTIFMWADHVFSNEDEFIADLRKIPEVIEKYPDNILIVGHTPVTPEVSLGYFEAGEKIDAYADVFKVLAFKEKPDLKTAKKFLAKGNYFWNLGCFSMKPDYLVEELLRQSPDLKKPVEGYREALAKGGEKKEYEAFQQFPKVSIEYTLIEKTKRIMAVTGDYGWTDIGYWSKVQEIFGVKGDHMPHGHHIHINSEGNYVYNATDKQVTLIGQKNSIVVITEDAILITSKEDCHLVKEVVNRLEEENKIDLL